MKPVWKIMLSISLAFSAPQLLYAKASAVADEEHSTGSLGLLMVLTGFFLFFLVIIPLLVLRDIKRSNIGTKPISFYTGLAMMHSFGSGNDNPYHQFSSGTGIFANKSNWKGGGSGSVGKW